MSRMSVDVRNEVYPVETAMPSGLSREWPVPMICVMTPAGAILKALARSGKKAQGTNGLSRHDLTTPEVDLGARQQQQR